jgi:hypothetical protein
MSEDRESALRRLKEEWPYLIEFLEALRESGGEPQLAYLEMRGTVFRGYKPDRFDAKLERALPWFPTVKEL